jgi:PIN domain nuclease of toxin-antitoxin system
MKALLDTHVFLWWVSGDPRLSQRAIDVIADGKNSLFLSAASGWEMAIKLALGKLILPGSLESFVSGQLAANSIQVLPVQMAHALHVSNLPPYHRDPFDRLLVAQAQLERMPILTGDPWIAKYPVEVIW